MLKFGYGEISVAAEQAGFASLPGSHQFRPWLPGTTHAGSGCSSR